MNETVDFSICEFIKDKMWFFTYYDFCDNRQSIRENFQEMSKNEKLFYKWYVYANIHMNETFKNAIWDYLNFVDSYGIELLKLMRFYKAK